MFGLVPAKTEPFDDEERYNPNQNNALDSLKEVPETTFKQAPTDYEETLSPKTFVSVKSEPFSDDEDRNYHNQRTVIVPIKGDPKTTSAVMQELTDFGEETIDYKLNKNLKDLYKDHEIKEEIVLGPETLGPCYSHQQLRSRKGDKHQPETTKIESRNKKIYFCSTCHKKFSQQSDLTCHLRSHTDEKPYMCSICNKRFTLKGHLLTHKRTHTGEKPYSCSICNKKFSRESDVIRHKRTHTGEKPYFCSVCNKKFSRKSSLTKHIRSHTGEKPYVCFTCSRKFLSKSNLDEHIRTHTGAKPYCCSTCNKKFSFKSNLNVHMRTHTGEKPYCCSTCNKKFLTNSHLTRHIRSHKY